MVADAEGIVNEGVATLGGVVNAERVVGVKGVADAERVLVVNCVGVADAVNEVCVATLGGVGVTAMVGETGIAAIVVGEVGVATKPGDGGVVFTSGTVVFQDALPLLTNRCAILSPLARSWSWTGSGWLSGCPAPITVSITSASSTREWK